MIFPKNPEFRDKFRMFLQKSQIWDKIPKIGTKGDPALGLIYSGTPVLNSLIGRTGKCTPFKNQKQQMPIAATNHTNIQIKMSQDHWVTLQAYLAPAKNNC